MTDQHPITPPSELVQQWEENWHHSKSNIELELYMAAQASQWGYDQCGEVNEAKLQQARDQELEACCEWLGTQWLGARTEGFPDELRAARRPKPPSLKEQALRAAHIEVDPEGKNGSLIIRALEALPDD